jgi:nitrite reductase/ring-hydroxylating ferredoxin subunit
LSFIKVAETSDIPLGKMKHVEVDEKEIMLASVDGKIYATSDRCSHMNARVSMGTLDKNIVTFPQHFSRFDVITEKMVSGPVEMTGSANMFEKCPEEVQKTILQLVQSQRKIQEFIKTYDQPIYEVKAEGNDIFVRV